jgi:uncharacterized protein
MKCPIDAADLLMSHRQDIEIDYCPTCRGMWLDRGELDKIIERNAVETERGRDDDRDDRQARNASDDRYDDDDRGGVFGRKAKKRKREGFLGELFFEFGA